VSRAGFEQQTRAGSGRPPASIVSAIARDVAERPPAEVLLDDLYRNAVAQPLVRGLADDLAVLEPAMLALGGKVTALRVAVASHTSSPSTS
jgi:hypothetical protein